MAKKEITIDPIPVEFGLHLGEYIHKYITTKTAFKLAHIAEELSISRSGLGNKLRRPSYGNVYDVIKISKLVNFNFFDIVSNIVLNSDPNITKMYSVQEYDQISDQLTTKENELKAKQREIDLLYDTIETHKNK